MIDTASRAGRILFGLFMVLLGLNKFSGYIELPSPPGDGGELMRIYVTSGFLKLVGALEFLGGVALVTNRFVPLALTVLTAILFNAFTYHAFHDPGGIGAAAGALLICVALVGANRARFADLLRA